MKTLETNDWIILNTIIYKVYTMEDFDGMRKELLEQLKLLAFELFSRLSSLLHLSLPDVSL